MRLASDRDVRPALSAVKNLRTNSGESEHRKATVSSPKWAPKSRTKLQKFLGWHRHWVLPHTWKKGSGGKGRDKWKKELWKEEAKGEEGKESNGKWEKKEGDRILTKFLVRHFVPYILLFLLNFYSIKMFTISRLSFVKIHAGWRSPIEIKMNLLRLGSC